MVVPRSSTIESVVVLSLYQQLYTAKSVVVPAISASIIAPAAGQTFPDALVNQTRAFGIYPRLCAITVVDDLSGSATVKGADPSR